MPHHLHPVPKMKSSEPINYLSAIKKFFLFFLLLFAVNLLSTTSAHAQGWYSDYVLVSNNGGSDAYYWIGTNPNFGTQFAGSTFTITYGQSLRLGCDMKFWWPSGGGVGGQMVYKVGTNALVYLTWSQSSLGGNDFQGTRATSGSNSDVASGLNAGTYNLSVYAQAWKNGVSDIYLNNSGSNYNATLTINKANQSSSASGTLSTSSITTAQTATVTASGGTGDGAYELRNNGGTATVTFSVSGSSITVTPSTAGTAIIEIRKLGGTNHNDTSWASVGTLTINAPAASITIGGSAANTTANDFTTTYGTASSAQTFNVAGTGLSASITATAGTGFEVSSDGTTYGGTATFTQSGGSASGSLRVRLAATASAGGTYTSATAATLTSTGATNRLISTDSAGSSVSKKALTVSTNATTVVYGSTVASVTNAGGFTLSGFANSETSAAGQTGNPTYSTTYAIGDAAGTAGRTITANFGSVTSTNYTYGTPSAGTVTISALGDPSAQSATAQAAPAFTQINTSWTRNGGYQVMVVRNTTNSFTNPTQGTSYAAGATIGSDTVVYAAGSGTSFNESSGALAPGTTYYYKFYSENNSYYSSGVTASATTGTAQAQNTSGSATPNQPATIYVGDNGIFGFEGWGQIGANYGNPRVVISQTTDLTAGLNGTYSGAVNTNAKTATSPRFTASGTWYWGIQVDYGSPYNAGFWYKASSASWTNYSNNGTGASLTITVSALVNPGSQTATVNGSTAVDLGWTNGVSGGSAKFTSIFRSTSSTAPTLTQGSAYATDTDHSIGGQTYRCIYNGSGTNFTDTGLSAGQTYYYYFFAENYNHYSSGVSATASLTSEHVYNVASGSTTESNALGGSGNLTKSGNGELVLTGANNYTGNTTISAGTLRINADTRLGGVPSPARANSITIGSGTLALDGAFTLNSNRGITLTSTGATIDDYGNNDTYNGIITNSGTAALTKVGGGILTLGGVNTYTGNTTISIGQIEITNASALGAGGSGNITSVASGAALRLSGGITVANELLTLNGTGVSDGGALRNVSGNNAWSSTITLAANARINSDSGTLTLGAISGGANVLYGIGAGDIAINGIISGDGASQDGTTTSIFKDGAGTLTLTGANTFTGDTRIVSGNLTVSGSGTLGSGSDIFVSNGGRLNVDVSTTVRSIGETGNNNGGIINIGSGAVLTINGNNAGGRFHHTLSGAGSLVFSGTGDTTLSVYNTASYTGNTTINSGTLTFDIAMSTANIIVNGGTFRLLTSGSANSANITIASGGVFDVDAQTTAFTMGSGKVLTIPATGADTTATIRVADAKDFTAYSRAITFSNFGSSNSTFPLTIANTGTPPAGGQGAFLMNSTSTVTINTSTQLGAGTYKLIGKSSAWGVVTNDSLPTPVITGAGAVGAASLVLAGTDSRELFLVIAKGSSTISATGTTSFTYTGSPQGPDGHSKTGSGGAVTFSYVGTGGTSYGPSATKPTNAGTYSANATVAADSNYEAATSAALAFTIAKASSTISVTGSTSFTYSGSPQGPDGHSKTGSGGAVTFSYVGTGGTSYTGSATKPTDVGTYSATATVAADSNYEAATSATYAFSITQATQAAVTGSLASSTITYNQTTTVTASGGTGTGAYDFRQNGGTGSVSFSGSGATRTLTPTAAGTAIIEVRRLGDSNYSASSWASAGTLTINLQVPAGLSVTMPSNTANITLNWSDISGETSYDVQHSTSSTWASATTITGITAGSTSRTVDVGAAGTYYIRVRGNSTAVVGDWSTTQVVQLRSLANGATAYLAPAGNVTTATVAGIFGASNAAGLAASSADNTATTIMLLNDAGATAHTLFYNNSASQWRGVGTSTTDRASESMPAGKAFMVKNNSGSTDFFILNAEPRTAPLTVSVNANAGQMNLLTPAKSTATALNSLNLTAGGDNTTTGIKRATLARDADVIMIQNGSGRFIPYHHDGTNWRNNRTVISDPSTVTVPAGGAFFIRKGPSSNFNSYTPPNE